MKVTFEVSFSFKSEIGAGRVAIDLEDGADVMAALRAIASMFPGVSSRIFDCTGKVRPYINVLKNGGNVRFQRGFYTPLKDGDSLSILPPVGGG